MKKASTQIKTGPLSKQPAAKTQKVQPFTTLSRRILPLVFFSSFFLFLLLYINPPVIYSNNGLNTHLYVSAMQAEDSIVYKDPWFRNSFILELTPPYFKEIATTPGGLTTLATTLCIYSCNYVVAGAFVITGIAVLFFILFALYLKDLGVRNLYYVHYTPVIFILLFCTWYELRPLALLLPIAGALGMARLHHHLKPIADIKRIVSASVLFWFAWYCMQWGCFLFLLFVLFDEYVNRQSRSTTTMVTLLVNSIVFCIVEDRLLPLDKTIHWHTFVTHTALLPVMIGYFPVATVIVAMVNQRCTADAKKPTLTKMVHRVIFACSIIGITGWIYKDPVNRTTRTIARTIHHIIKGTWNALLDEKNDLLFSRFPENAGPLQLFMIHATNQALCRTGQAGEKLFMYPQASFNYNPLLMLESIHRSGIINWVAVLELTMDLGMINSAEKIAGELMETIGPYPELLYRRALIQIARENHEAAAIYLNRLSHMPFLRKEAIRLLKSLHNENVCNTEPRLATMYGFRDTIDYFLFNKISHDELLQNLLQSNPGNKLAYDYLVCYRLLTGQLDNIAGFLQVAPYFGYRSLPRYWEEALCMNLAVQAQKSSSKASFTGLRPETVNRFYSFTQSWLQRENDPTAAVTLAPSFGDTYFYFSLFRHSRGVFR